MAGKQRAKGEGSIYQRSSDGLWIGSVEAGYDGNGKRVQKRVSSMDYRTLVAKMDALKADLADGLDIDRSMTVEKWLNYWLPNIHKNRIRPTTYRDYGHTAKLIIQTIGHKRLADLTPAHVRGMHKSLGPTRRRTAKAHIVLTKALKDAVAEGIIKRNVAAVVDQPHTVVDDERKAFTVPETRAILETAASTLPPMDAVRWLAAFLTGTRQGETLGLTWDRVDLDRCAVDISWQLQQLSRSHGCNPPCGKRNVGYCPSPIWDVPAKFKYKPLHAGLCLTKPKSDAGNRWIPIIGPLRDALIGLKESDTGTNPHNLVFHRPDGRPINPSDDHGAWTALLRAAGVIGEDETRPLHLTRHTAATVLRASGVDEQTRMEILGHNSPEVTRVYAHADQAKNSAMMDALEVLLPEPKELPA